MKISNITWETDGLEIDLPREVELPSNIDVEDDESVCNYLSDTYGFLVISYAFDLGDEYEDEFGNYVNYVEGVVS
jgi:hypothetical protein